MSRVRYLTLPVAATAYTVNYRTGQREYLTHIVDAEQDYAPLCSRVRPGSILQDMALAEAPEKATCPACRSQYAEEMRRAAR